MKNKTSNLKSHSHAEDYTEDTKTVIETQGPINCLINESTDVTSILRTPILNIESCSETEESLEESFDKVRTDKTH